MGNLLQLSCADLVLEKNVTKNDKIKIVIPVPLPLTNELLRGRGNEYCWNQNGCFFSFVYAFTFLYPYFYIYYVTKTYGRNL